MRLVSVLSIALVVACGPVRGPDQAIVEVPLPARTIGFADLAGGSGFGTAVVEISPEQNGAATLQVWVTHTGGQGDKMVRFDARGRQPIDLRVAEHAHSNAVLVSASDATAVIGSNLTVRVGGTDLALAGVVKPAFAVAYLGDVTRGDRSRQGTAALSRQPDGLSVTATVRGVGAFRRAVLHDASSLDPPEGGIDLSEGIDATGMHVRITVPAASDDQIGALEDERFVISWLTADEMGGHLRGGLVFAAETAENKRLCKVPKQPSCEPTVSRADGKTTLTCTYHMNSLGKDPAKHEECDKEHGRITQKCKANIASAGTENERTWCTSQPAPRPVPLKCVSPDTATPLAIDAELNDTITRP